MSYDNTKLSMKYPKEILSKLLTSMLNSKLLPLEVRNDNEMLTLTQLSQSSNKIIAELDSIDTAMSSMAHSKQPSKTIQHRTPVSKSPVPPLTIKPKPKTRNHLTKNITAKSYTPSRNNTNLSSGNTTMITNNNYRIDTSINTLSTNSKVLNANKGGNMTTRIKNKKVFVVKKKTFISTSTSRKDINNTKKPENIKKKIKAKTPTPDIHRGKIHTHREKNISTLISKDLFTPNPNRIHKEEEHHLFETENNIDHHDSINFLGLPEIRLSSIPITVNKEDNVSDKENSGAYGELFETNFDLIAQYLSISQLLSFVRVNKQLGINAINALIYRTESEIEEINNNISQILKIYNPNEKKIQSKFMFTKSSLRAIQILNEKNSDSIFIKRDFPKNNSKDILFIYNIFFCILTNKNIQNTIKDDFTFWRYICDFFTNRKSNISLGSFIENQIRKINFDTNNELLYKLYTLSNSNIHKIKPNYYQNICKTTGIIVFIIKDIIDYLGLSKDRNVSSGKIYRVLNARLDIQNRFLMKLNSLNGKFFN